MPPRDRDPRQWGTVTLLLSTKANLSLYIKPRLRSLRNNPHRFAQHASDNLSLHHPPNSNTHNHIPLPPPLASPIPIAQWAAPAPNPPLGTPYNQTDPGMARPQTLHAHGRRMPPVGQPRPKRGFPTLRRLGVDGGC